MYDAVVVGAGPNGLAASIRLAQAGASVLVVEQHDQPGGGCRSAELNLPGFLHDVCSAVHPMGAASPYLRSLSLADHGLQWLHPEVLLAHPLDDGSAGVLLREVEDTARALDDPGWSRLLGPLVESWDDVLDSVLAPVLRVPRHPLSMGRFGLRALWPATVLASRMLANDRSRALFAGIAAHSVNALERPLTSAAGILLAGAGHAAGWPVAAGGSQRIVDALVSSLGQLGGRIETGRRIRSLGDLPATRTVLFDTAPRDLLAVAGARFTPGYRRRLGRYRHAPGSFKVDYALSGPVPWTAEECRRAGTVHVGGTLAEVAAAEADVAQGRHPERPFVLVAQQSLVDAGRAPVGQHTLWAYCHVPAGSTLDMTGALEGQLERFAPGFSDLVLARTVSTAGQLEAYNPNCVGGDIAGGATDGLQLLFRPIASAHPHRTPAPDIFLCSASTPPGGGVHGMCGFWAAQEALRFLERRS
ncbi:MAG TPA: NAD(P)/FAD-dependent oxidoreductase [Acidimicrobiales bacterium]|nr:NAD(P)/FAD-dependent oxidoreductase [Acidimicrobiales bacterium]